METLRQFAIAGYAQKVGGFVETNHHFGGVHQTVSPKMRNMPQRRAATSYKLKGLRKIIQPRSEIYCSFTKSRLYMGHIRPLEVSPLNNPERAPKPWGFLRLCPSPTANDLEVAA